MIKDASASSAVSQLWDVASRFLNRYGVFVVMGMFVLAGFGVVDDYGVSIDEDNEYYRGKNVVDYILGNIDDLGVTGGGFYIHDRFYGVAFEAPLQFIERALDIEDSRDIHLIRHIVTHLFFLTGGFFCYLLVYRLFDNRFLAVLAMLMFLLHPRLYAHSFFNTKDIPFVSMFMICLYLTHRALNRGNVWWFLALGVGSGILVNLRIMGIVLFFGVLGMLSLDLLYASSNRERRYILMSIAVVAYFGVMTLYITSPFLWSDHVGGVVDWFAMHSQHPNDALQLFRGELFRSATAPRPDYLPVWFSITTPPLVLALGFVGGLYVLLRGMISPRDVLVNTRLRFGFMLIGCFLLPIVSVIVLSSNVHNGWRQMYFLYVPFCVLAIFGLKYLMCVFGNLRLRFGAALLGCSGVAVTVVSMVAIHPHEHVYFNFLVDRSTPEHLRMEYDMDYWGASAREGLEVLLERYPDSQLSVTTTGVSQIGDLNRWILPQSDRKRIYVTEGRSDFRVMNYRSVWTAGEIVPDSSGPFVYTRTIYNNTLFTITGPHEYPLDVPTLESYRELYGMTVSGEPAARGYFDLYILEDELVYIRDSCVRADTAPAFFLHFYPLDLDALPDNDAGEIGFDNQDFRFDNVRGELFDGRCLIRIGLPEYEIDRIHTGQWLRRQGRIWGAQFVVSD